MVLSFNGVPATIGVFTDVQYANKQDQTLRQLYGIPDDVKTDSNLSTIRCYSLALSRASKAIDNFNANKVAATIHLGDIVDGNKTPEETQCDLDAVLKTLKPLESPILHVLGNHCLAVERVRLQKALGLSHGTYYSFDVSPKWRLIVLDTVDVSMYREKDHPSYKEAEDYIAKNPDKPNAQTWNGTISSSQKDWLRSTLEQTRNDGKLAIVCGHIPIYMPESYGPDPQHVIYDFDSVGSLFNEFQDVVKAYFAGHFHQGGYVRKNNIHYVTFESILDSTDPNGAWGIVHLYNNGIVIEGYGDMTSRHLII